MRIPAVSDGGEQVAALNQQNAVVGTIHNVSSIERIQTWSNRLTNDRTRLSDGSALRALNISRSS